MSQITVNDPGKYLPSLDGLRAIAVLAVMLYHVRGYFEYTPLHRFISCGWIGVDLFFVISGLLITRILLWKKGTPGYFLEFYRRRVFRIWPLYFAIVAVTFGYYLLTHRLDSVRWLAYLTFTQNFFTDGVWTDWLRASWSLAIEEQYYLIWPLAIAFLPRRVVSRLALLALIASPLMRAVLLARTHDDYAKMYLFTYSHLDGILVGSLLALWLSSETFSLRKAKLLLLFMILFGVVGTCLTISKAGAMEQHSVYVFSMLALASGGIVGLCAIGQMPGSRLLTLAPVRYVGTISYGLYLLHLLIFETIRRLAAHIRIQGFALLAIQLLAVMGVAALSWRFFETPILRHGHSTPASPEAKRMACSSL